MYLFFEPVILLLGNSLEEIMINSKKDLSTRMITTALFIIVKNWIQHKC